MTKQKKATHSKATNGTVRSEMKVTMVKGKAGLHKRNLHHSRYDFNQLVKATPELKKYVVKNPKGEASINFADPQAVKLLNKALLAHHYGVISWDIPKGYLCPPIPGRADYIHRLAELLSKDGKQVKHESVNAFDVGVGANCIYYCRGYPIWLGLCGVRHRSSFGKEL